jgi:hypothetical protein
MKYHAEYSPEGDLVYEVRDDAVTVDRRHKGEDAGFFVMGDIQPYQSQLTGEYVQSRSRHRSLLREHNCIEVGNETKYLRPKPVTPAPGLKQRLIEVVNSKT